MTDGPPVVRENRVRFAETDQQGVVFYGVYFTYMDEAFNEYLRQVDYGYDQMAAEGWTTHVVHADLDFHAAAGFGDRIENRLRVASLGTSSLAAEYEARHADDGTLLADGSVVHVAVDDDGDAIAVPDGFREAVVDHQAVAPEREGEGV